MDWWPAVGVPYEYDTTAVLHMWVSFYRLRGGVAGGVKIKRGREIRKIKLKNKIKSRNG